MTLSQLARILGKASVYTRDVNAIRRGRAKERVANRVMGRALSNLMRGRWF